MSSSSDSTSTSEPADVGQPETWEDWEESESEGFKSLFTDERFGSLEQVLRHDRQASGFSLRQYRAQHGLDQINTIRLINFIRSEVAAGRDPLPALSSDGSALWRDDDAYLQPVLMDDELMFHDWEGEEEQEAAAAELGAPAGSASTAQTAAAAAGPASVQAGEVQRLLAENEALRGMVEAMRELVLQQDDGMRELLSDQAAAAGPSASSAAAQPPPQQQQQQQQASKATAGPADDAAKRIDDSYFDSYSTFDIHREMLSDKVRTDAYRDALEKNPSLLKGARVLDVGCGTGILSMFAARGGAASVVGIDGSEQIAKFARANVEANALSSTQGGPITIVASKVEQLAALPAPPAQQQADAAGSAIDSGSGSSSNTTDGQQVDVLVSEWMGYALLFESMLSSVLHARDRWLKPGGAILPDVAKLYLAAAGEGASGLDFWKDVYGFSMESVRSSLAADALKRGIVRPVAPQHLLSEPACLHTLDLATMRDEDQDFTAPFTLTPSAGPKDCHALVLWFDTLFSDRFCKQHPVELSTSPCGPQTHWVQTVLLLKAPVTLTPAVVAGGDARAVVALTGQLGMSRSRQTHRSLDIVLRYTAKYADGTAGEEQVVLYGMGVEA